MSRNSTFTITKKTQNSRSASQEFNFADENHLGNQAGLFAEPQPDHVIDNSFYLILDIRMLFLSNSTNSDTGYGYHYNDHVRYLIEDVYEQLHDTHGDTIQLKVRFINKQSRHDQQITKFQFPVSGQLNAVDYGRILQHLGLEHEPDLFFTDQSIAVACTTDGDQWQCNFADIVDAYPDCNPAQAAVIWSGRNVGKVVNKPDGLLELRCYDYGKLDYATKQEITSKLESDHYQARIAIWEIDDAIFLNTPSRLVSSTILNQALIPVAIKIQNDSNFEHFVVTQRPADTSYITQVESYLTFYKENRRKLIKLIKDKNHVVFEHSNLITSIMEQKSLSLSNLALCIVHMQTIFNSARVSLPAHDYNDFAQACDWSIVNHLLPNHIFTILAEWHNQTEIDFKVQNIIHVDHHFETSFEEIEDLKQKAITLINLTKDKNPPTLVIAFESDAGSLSDYRIIRDKLAEHGVHLVVVAVHNMSLSENSMIKLQRHITSIEVTEESQASHSMSQSG